MNLDEIENLIIDGNNLFYVDPEIRKLLLQNKSKKKASIIITELAD